MNEDTLKWGKMDEKGFLSKVIKKYNPKQRVEFTRQTKPLKGYVSGSIYAGEWSPLDMDGAGTYILSHGAVYEGNLKDGMFHGKGVLRYPMGQMVVGEWYKGEIMSWTFKYKNIKQCTLDTYCKQPDRRFLTTIYNKLLPAGEENLTNEQPTKKIPEGCYDVVDGFYNPKTLWVHSSKNMGKVLYMPALRRKSTNLSYFNDAEEEANFIRKVPFVPIYKTCQWIEANCRKAWDEPTGLNLKLYEYWFTGRKSDEQNLNMRVQKQGGKFIWEESVCDEFLWNFEVLAARQNMIMREDIGEEQENQEEGEMEDVQAVKFASIAVSEPESLMPEDVSSFDVSLTSEAKGNIVSVSEDTSRLDQPA